MNPHTALVVTSISGPNPALLMLAEGCRLHNIQMIVIGDTRSPPDFHIPGVDFYDLAAQRASGLAYSAICPERHYARKNIGYLLACRAGAELIIETDDDNLPKPEFWEARERFQILESAGETGWLNIYRHFSDTNIWPRGFPLAAIRRPPSHLAPPANHDCPIQQGLADGNPDVDAVYRLTLPLPVNFAKRAPLALKEGAWCPFNSQNTTWFRDAFPLMYLPATCSFRMTDIWRSFVAQRLAWESGWSVMFHHATVSQDRNGHDLMQDFAEEIPGYLHNPAIAEALDSMVLDKGTSDINKNLRACYGLLLQMGLVAELELQLLDAWLEDISPLLGR